MSNIVSQFYGMTILMPYTVKENARPYFEVEYEGKTSKFEIDTSRMIEGILLDDGKEIVIEWSQDHRRELIENWKRILNKEPLKPIEPIL
jgi:hypothetical protein